MAVLDVVQFHVHLFLIEERSRCQNFQEVPETWSRDSNLYYLKRHTVVSPEFLGFPGISEIPICQASLALACPRKRIGQLGGGSVGGSARDMTPP